MRQLNKKQKKFIDKAMDTRIIKSVNDLTLDELHDLEKMNDHETMWSNTNRHIHDKIMDGFYDGRWETLPKSDS